MGATMTLFLRIFSRRTHDHLEEVERRREDLRSASRKLEVAKAGQQEASRNIQEAIIVNEMCECQRTDVTQEYIANEKRKSGLHEGVAEDADNTAKE